MKYYNIKTYPSKFKLKKERQLAWKIAKTASDKAKLNTNCIEMAINRIIDNTSVAIASLNRKPVISAREMAKAHFRKNGATLYGVNSKLKFDCEWAAWANCTAVRELDFHDTFLAADYSHPGDNIPPLLAVAQQLNKNGIDLLKGINNFIDTEINNMVNKIIDIVSKKCKKIVKEGTAEVCPEFEEIIDEIIEFAGGGPEDPVTWVAIGILVAECKNLLSKAISALCKKITDDAESIAKHIEDFVENEITKIVNWVIKKIKGDSADLIEEGGICLKNNQAIHSVKSNNGSR